jgi:hypothetical protein
MTAPDDAVDLLPLPSPRCLLEPLEAGGSSTWAHEAARGLGALLAMGPREPCAEDLAPLRREVGVRAARLALEGPGSALTGLQREYDAYFTTVRRAPTVDTFVAGLVQASHEVLQELALPNTLTPGERCQLLAGLETAARLVSGEAGR